MFTPAKMKKVRIIFQKPDIDKVIELLGRTAFVQVENLDKNARELLESYSDKEHAKIDGYLQQLKSLRANLPGKKEEINNESIDLKKAEHAFEKLRIKETLPKLIKEREDILNGLNSDKKKLNLLLKISDFSDELDLLDTEHVSSFIVDNRDIEAAEEALEGNNTEFNEIKLKECSILNVENTDNEITIKLFLDAKIKYEQIKGLKGKIKENLRELKRETDAKKQGIKKIDEKLCEISKLYSKRIDSLLETFEREKEKMEVIYRLGVSDYLSIIEGWIDNNDITKLDEELKEVTGGRYLIETIETDENPPTKLINPIKFKIYEAFVKFYSFPKSSEVDPTIFFGIAFPVFFGLMIGDMGYGLFTLVLSLYLIWRLTHKVKHDILPRWLKNFMHTIVSNNGLLIIAKGILPGSIVGIVFGFIFNEFFGAHLLPFYVFYLIKNVKTLLLISGWVGVFMVSFGFTLGAVDNLLINNKKKAAGRVGWLLLSWGIVILGLNVLQKESLSLSNLSALAAYILLVIGFLFTVSSEGVGSILEVPSVISHILSYTRLVGILLASVILAEVINLSVSYALRGPIWLIAAGLVILVFGQIFNIIIAMFEAGIQGARLIYVEFFSKFYTGNGDEFEPFKLKATREKMKNKTPKNIYRRR
ncbi:hypothetical protein IHE51_01635 [Candidatus Parvarchaeota archaeon]|uniref:A-type ATP synthase subunit I n=1 Tax=Candidatus Acidifodinimicrobium mancum TaxID=2898728 RepID=A0A8T3UW17_9ARCH|nr:hypothetical protein [Candidatus Acidifodinimicrobium mancum]